MKKLVDLVNQSIISVGSRHNIVDLDGEKVLRVVKDKNIIEDDEATYAKFLDTDFHNGTIKLKVLSKLLLDAPEHARGFIGIAFRINKDDSLFESIYIRPANGRCEIQLRRNRATQYFSFPDFKYMHSRETNPGEYESYVDIDLNQWIDFRVEVKDQKAKLFINDSESPVLIVNDMKMGSEARGAVGMFVDIGTDGYFKDIEIDFED